MNIEFEKHIDSLFRFAFSLSGDFHVSEELTQECLCRAYDKAGQLVNRDAAKAWLFRMLINLWRDRLRRASNAGIVELGDPGELPSREHSVENKLSQNEELDEVLRAMQRLPQRQRQVLHLRSVEDLSIGEIAQWLGITAGAVKSNLAAARKTINRKLTNSARAQS